MKEKDLKLSLIIFCFTLFLIGCSSSHKKMHPKASIAGLGNSSPGPVLNKNKKAVANPEVIKGKYDIEREVKSILSKDWEKNFWFEVVDNKNGFAKMGGYFEGYNAYYLFVGEKSNLLVEASWGCGPACSQVVSFYKKFGETYKMISFDSIFDLNALKNLKDQLNVCISAKSFNSWSNEKCSLMLDLPNVGTTVKIYQAQFLEDGVYSDRYGIEGKRVATIVWDRKNFKFIVESK